MRQSLRFAVLQRDDFRCRYCGATASETVKLHVDHIHPRSKGGLDEMENLVTACFDCNIGKGARVLRPIHTPKRTYRSRGPRTPSLDTELEALRAEFPVGSHCCTPLKIAAMGHQLGLSSYFQAHRYFETLAPGGPPLPPLRRTDYGWYRVVSADRTPGRVLVEALSRAIGGDTEIVRPIVR